MLVTTMPAALYALLALLATGPAPMGDGDPFMIDRLPPPVLGHFEEAGLGHNEGYAAPLPPTKACTEG